MSPVNTKKVQRRPIRLASLDELLAEADRLATAERQGRLARLGNWTLGQALNHVAVWINFGYEGFPPGAKPPTIIRFLLRFMRKKFLDDALPAGVKIPKVEGGTYGVEMVSTDEGLARLREAVRRLRTEKPRFPSPAFGEMTEEERVKLNLRHAELHLGFMDA
jgi:hypothetical protein